METVLRPLTVAGSAVAVTLAVGWTADRMLRRADARHPETPLWQLLRRCRLPLQVALCAGLLLGGYRAAHVGRGHEEAIEQVLVLVLIAAMAWLVMHGVGAVVETGYARYAAASHDPARLRRVRTQVTLIQRVVTAAVGIVAAAVMLMQFPAMRAVGTSVLASAGVIAAVAGIAAQSTLGNLFAGLQIAFGDMVRIGDTVVVQGEWGTVEEITLTYLVVSTWDERRITMPVSYFTSRPFENWSRGSAQMTGTVFFHLDHAVPVDLMRERLHQELKECEAWDGRAWSLVVTDTTPTTIQVRALATAKDSADLWTLRCTIRERLIDWLRCEHPYALPRVNTAPAPGHDAAPDRGAAAGPRPGDIGPGPGTAPPPS
ncbi:mechanosensitive ion channel family protein [Streptomyces sp. RB6PN25]|uniref:Mechanosensitive ion channel family protein n=1 Tax=Streptomyces humicola TaxID=2953240 RepID=A0ABT1PQ74_9ACTN|nr:mechanosensitive ion channel domain-containing protein [Streptomyces humicola]MCQ4079821.1 mechanosensitive ion channel family protein [Streptomyces humicola]